MVITFRCECGKLLRWSDSHAGDRARCPNCYAMVTVPSDDDLDVDMDDDLPAEKRWKSPRALKAACWFQLVQVLLQLLVTVALSMIGIWLWTGLLPGASERSPRLIQFFDGLGLVGLKLGGAITGLIIAVCYLRAASEQHIRVWASVAILLSCFVILFLVFILALTANSIWPAGGYVSLDPKQTRTFSDALRLRLSLESLTLIFSLSAYSIGIFLIARFASILGVLKVGYIVSLALWPISNVAYWLLSIPALHQVCACFACCCSMGYGTEALGAFVMTNCVMLVLWCLLLSAQLIFAWKLTTDMVAAIQDFPE